MTLSACQLPPEASSRNLRRRLLHADLEGQRVQEAGLPVGTVRPIPLVRGIGAHIQARASSLLETREHVRSSGGWFPAVSFLPSLSMGTTSADSSPSNPRSRPDRPETWGGFGPGSCPLRQRSSALWLHKCWAQVDVVFYKRNGGVCCCSCFKFKRISLSFFKEEFRRVFPWFQFPPLLVSSLVHVLKVDPTHGKALRAEVSCPVHGHQANPPE